MPKSNSTLSDVPAYVAAFREFDAAQTALFNLVSHVRLVDQQLDDNFADLPEAFQPAATVLHDATKALDALHSRYERFSLSMSDVRYGAGWRERLKREMHGESDAPKTAKGGNGARRARA